jgi:hypothetical protein
MFPEPMITKRTGSSMSALPFGRTTTPTGL